MRMVVAIGIHPVEYSQLAHTLSHKAFQRSFGAERRLAVGLSQNQRVAR